MVPQSKKREIAFALFVGLILAAGLYWVIGEWIAPLMFCGFSNERSCNLGTLTLTCALLSMAIAGIITAYNIRRITKK